MGAETMFHQGLQIGHTSGWWAVYTKHQHEKTAAEILAIKGAEVFLPLYGTTHRWKDRVVHLTLPLFPSYMFVRAQQEMRLPILSTPGVLMIVGHGAGFAVLEDTEIQNLRSAVERPHAIQPHPFLNVGERVRIVRGPLTGVEGILTRRKNLCRVVVSVEMLRQSASIEVNEWDVAHASKARAASLAHAATALSLAEGT